MEIVSGYFKFCSNNSLDFNEMSGNVPNLYQKVSQMDESALTSWIIGMSLKISETVEKCQKQYVKTSCDRGSEYCERKIYGVRDHA